MWEGAKRGEAKKYGEKKKKKSRIGEARTGRKRGTGDPETLWGHCRLVLARSCPFTTFFFFRAFFFFFLSYCRFKHSFEQSTAAAMFFLERAYTYRLVCVQATFACSDKKKRKEKEERRIAIKWGGHNREDKKRYEDHANW